ncbi:phenylacetate-CoA oxygenase, PaaJ subunit [Schinkia azotoformans MEV2011]|uniref:Phenylacetate-CoA oxygenase, PaaJ subunit n=1 Tax=Schinkia azotoformans MEV2011 TaxID=1348973 RepID=A0A072NJL2_SCHAZ|nr:1,2-phenylacetyl-CoA epoxidase subunit PaaD [Schinkia azotoformans]KEF37467.1 phenylacetate-CoA oxygenase, PaaJ subunit [Schinkia azotoformans MEV2011]MEC1697792.1 phenylacetate-CoA oxygenase subunit PaaJ [Schinkia azotoformans]MEC1715947.1 phenylacetate-CoA oxygenase subunit PaaJ [Schinkia azotoformans]MEC1726206.1 phenylacetate-CoA oxygenase subunit PaaJ [Schinkia azotoformans]MEC1740100.1 phenylacetate-CoA oxygenase subunit PaaJ [Schinkia azotoformans]
MIISQTLEEKVKQQIETVYDPEIDTINIVDLGMLGNVSILAKKVTVELLPTFLGCPALGIIKENVIKAISELNEVEEVVVNYINTPPWTSASITEKGREALKQFGIAPPPIQLESDGSWQVDCPYCGSPYNTLENIFGPSACRSLLYCKECKNPFEAMKPISIL